MKKDKFYDMVNAMMEREEEKNVTPTTGYLLWWEGLSPDEQTSLCQKHFKGIPIEKLMERSIKVMYHYEHTETIKEDTPNTGTVTGEGFTGGCWGVWEDYERDAKPEKNPCFSIRSFVGSKIIAKTFQNIDEPPASKIALANANRIVKAVNNYDSLVSALQDMVDNFSPVIDGREEIKQDEILAKSKQVLNNINQQ